MASLAAGQQDGHDDAGAAEARAAAEALTAAAREAAQAAERSMSLTGTESPEQLTSLSVQNTSLDDVFVHYTGRQLRDEQVRAVFSMPRKGEM